MDKGEKVEPMEALKDKAEVVAEAKAADADSAAVKSKETKTVVDSADKKDQEGSAGGEKKEWFNIINKNQARYCVS